MDSLLVLVPRRRSFCEGRVLPGAFVRAVIVGLQFGGLPFDLLSALGTANHFACSFALDRAKPTLAVPQSVWLDLKSLLASGACRLDHATIVVPGRVGVKITGATIVAEARLMLHKKPTRRTPQSLCVPQQVEH